MRPILALVLITALRDRLYPGLALLVAATLGLVLLVGGTSLIEKGQTALVLAGGAVRLVLAVGVVAFIAFHVQRLFDTREIEVLLARPISRLRVAAALGLGMALVAALPAAVVGTGLALFARDGLGGALWAATLVAEAAILALFTTAAALVLERAVPAALAALAFYVAGRLTGFLAAIVAAKTGAFGNAADPLIGGVVTGLNLLLPRLDLMAGTAWLAHGTGAGGIPPAEAALPLLQGLVYGALLVTVAAIDLSRKRF